MNGFREGPDNRPFFLFAGKTPRADEIVEEDQYCKQEETKWNLG